MQENKKKRASQSDIAKYAGVSRSAVSYILNNAKGKKFSDETKKKVLDAAKEYGYKADPFGKGLKTKSARTIALLLPNLTDPSFPILIKGVEASAISSDYCVMILDRDRKDMDKVQTVEVLSDKPIDGVIYAYPDAADDPAIDILTDKYKIPTVFIGVKKDKHSHIDNVRYDYFNACRVLAEHLLNLGHRKIALVFGDVNINTYSKEHRIKALTSVFENHGIKIDIIIGKQKENNRSSFYDTREYDRGFATALEIIEKGLNYTAIIGSNELVSIGLMNAFKSNNRLIPNDISIASFGGTLISEVVNPQLTVMEIPHYELGEKAFEILLPRLHEKLVKSPKEMIIGCNIILRGSTREV